MNLRQPIRINEPIANKPLKLMSLYNEEEFNSWQSLDGSLYNVISIEYVLSNTMKNGYQNKTDIHSSNMNENKSYEYYIKVLYQEK